MKKRGADGRQLNLGQPTLTEAVNWYVSQHVAMMPKPGTRKTFSWILSDYVARLSDHPTEDDLHELHVDGVKTKRLLAGTCNTRRRILSRALDCARQHWPLLYNFARLSPTMPAAVPAPRGLAEPMKTFPVLLAAMPDARAGAFLLTQRGSGLRPGEARGLWPKDFRFDADGGSGGAGPTMAVMRQRGIDQSAPAALKYDTCAATVEIEPELVQLVREARRDRMKAGAPRGVCARDFEFPYYRQDQDALLALCRQVAPTDFPSRVPGVAGADAFHVLRHTFCTEAVDEFGEHVETVQQLMRHKNLSSTQGYIASLRGGFFPNDAKRRLIAKRAAARAAMDRGTELASRLDVKHDAGRVSRVDHQPDRKDGGL